MTLLATAICLNVVVTKLSLINLTPSYQCVNAMFVTNFALMNFFLYQVTIPQRALLASIPALLLSLSITIRLTVKATQARQNALIAAIVACWVVFMTAMYLAIDWVVQQALPDKKHRSLLTIKSRSKPSASCVSSSDQTNSPSAALRR